MWYFCLGYCRPEIIKQLYKYNSLKVIKSYNVDAFCTMQCDMCEIFKMHQLINQIPSDRTTKLYKILHFDIIILKKFDAISCIIYFIDEYLFYCWVFLLINYKKNVDARFKNVIKKCDCADLIINLIVLTIRNRQKTSINEKLKK